jgi:exodeoxyribonuclease VII large subunit
LHSVSPLATLDRGYAILKIESTGEVLTDAANIDAGSDVRALLSRGELIATVKKVMNND